MIELAFRTCFKKDVLFREQRQMFLLQLWPRLELRSAGNPFTYFKGNIA
jgi:hypothetical protein